MKYCSTCKNAKEDSEFKSNKTCIKCSEECKNYREEHKEEIKIRSKKYIEKNKEEIKVHNLFNHAKNRARKKNLEFTITIDDIKELIATTPICPLLEIEFKSGDGTICDSSRTIDRIIPSKGYTKNNIQLISHKANRMKSDLSLQELKEFLYNWEMLENSQIITITG